MGDELRDLTEHLERYRATTVQVFDLVEEEDLSWRPMVSTNWDIVAENYLNEAGIGYSYAVPGPMGIR